MLEDNEQSNSSKMQFVCKPSSSNITGNLVIIDMLQL